MENINLTVSEHSQIWGAYMNASLSSCVLKYFIEKVEDQDVQPVLQETLSLSQRHLENLTKIFEKENKPIPFGFTDQDVNPNAPRLYSDNYFLQYVFQMSGLGMFSYSTSISLSTREDVYSFFSEGFREYNDLHQHAASVLLEKGLYVRPPTVPTTNEVDFVKKQNFLAGWFGERRPLTASEIANLFSNIQRNNLGMTTLTGFSQVAKSKEVKEFIIRGIEIAKKHINVFSSVLEDSQIPVPTGGDSMVTDSNKVSPFSDKLIMFHVVGMITLGIGFYGLSISTNTRRDVALHFTRLTGEILLYSEDGSNLLIKNEWLEEPPRMVDRSELAKSKK